MNEIMDRIAAGKFAAYKRNRYARYWLGGGLILAIYTAVSATFDTEARPGDLASILPIYLPMMIGFFLSPFARHIFSSIPAEAKYDEFEANALNVAQGRAYSCLLLSIFALILWLWLGTSFDFAIPKRPYDWSAIFLTFLAIGTALPVFMTECLIPMPPVDDMDTDDAA